MSQHIRLSNPNLALLSLVAISISGCGTSSRERALAAELVEAKANLEKVQPLLSQSTKQLELSTQQITELRAKSPEFKCDRQAIQTALEGTELGAFSFERTERDDGAQWLGKSDSVQMLVIFFTGRNDAPRSLSLQFFSDAKTSKEQFAKMAVVYSTVQGLLLSKEENDQDLSYFTEAMLRSESPAYLCRQFGDTELVSHVKVKGSFRAINFRAMKRD